jgi:hypothetical protein
LIVEVRVEFGDGAGRKIEVLVSPWLSSPQRRVLGFQLFSDFERRRGEIRHWDPVVAIKERVRDLAKITRPTQPVVLPINASAEDM